MSALRWLLCLALLGACAKKAAPAEDEADEAAAPIATECVAARAGDAHAHVSLRGVVTTPPDRSATVAPQVAGRVVGLRVHEGDKVAAGALLATIEDPALGEAVVESDATHASAQAALANADAALARARRLFDQGIAARRDVEDAEARRAAALAEAQAADARGGLARAQRGKARVTAPIAGVVIKVYRRNGELVDGTPATPLVDIADPARLELRADAPAAQLVRLVEGAAAEVRLDALPGVTFAAKLAYVSPAVDPLTSLGVVRAAIVPAEGAPSPKLGLAGALSVSVPGPAGVVLVPQVALRRAAGGGEEVVVCDDAGKDGAVAHLRAVETGGRVGGDVEITSGLKEGERVATRHVVALEEGAAIEVAKPAPPAEAAPPGEPAPPAGTAPPPGATK
jgi:RND family efflux transporter MFP subunit